MIDELVYPKDISKEMLIELLDQAYVDYEIIKGGLFTTEDCPCEVIPADDGGMIRLVSSFATNAEATHEVKLVVANKLNIERNVLRAGVDEKGNLLIDHHILVAGGITKGHIIRSIRFFKTNVDLEASSDDLRAVLK